MHIHTMRSCVIYFPDLLFDLADFLGLPAFFVEDLLVSLSSDLDILLAIKLKVPTINEAATTPVATAPEVLIKFIRSPC